MLFQSVDSPTDAEEKARGVEIRLAGDHHVQQQPQIGHRDLEQAARFQHAGAFRQGPKRLRPFQVFQHVAGDDFFATRVGHRPHVPDIGNDVRTTAGIDVDTEITFRPEIPATQVQFQGTLAAYLLCPGRLIVLIVRGKERLFQHPQHRCPGVNAGLQDDPDHFQLKWGELFPIAGRGGAMLVKK